MITLLRTDIFKILKNKLTIIVLIVSVGLGLLSGLLYGGLNALVNSDALNGDGSYFAIFRFFEITQNGFSLGNDAGFVVPVFAGIFIVTDISSGILRNKIIFGQDRRKVYFSHFITTVIFNLVFVTLYFITLTGISLIFFFPEEAPESYALTNYFLNLVLGIFGLIFISSFTTFLGLGVKSSPIVIIFTALVGMLLTILSSLLNISLCSLEIYDTLKYFLYLIPTYASTDVIYAMDVAYVPFFEGVAGFLLFSAINCVLGCTLFCKKDIK